MVNICICGCERNLSVEICGTLEYVSQVCEMSGCTEVPGLGETICNSCWDKHDSADIPGFPSEYDCDTQEVNGLDFLESSPEGEAFADKAEQYEIDKACGDHESVDWRDENETYVVDESLPCVAPRDAVFVFCSDCGHEGSDACGCQKKKDKEFLDLTNNWGLRADGMWELLDKDGCVSFIGGKRIIVTKDELVEIAMLAWKAHKSLGGLDMDDQKCDCGLGLKTGDDLCPRC